MQTTFQGYRRENGRVGVRNHVLILPVDDLSNAAAEAVADSIKGAMAIPHKTAPFTNLAKEVTFPEPKIIIPLDSDGGERRKRRRS